MAGKAANPKLPWTLELEMLAAFEECLEFEWRVVARPGATSGSSGAPPLRDSTVQMAIDRTGNDALLEPPKNAMIKTVPFGKDKKASLQNMPEGRKFFIAVEGVLASGEVLKSPWVRAATLSPKDRDKDLGNLDPMNKPRLNCLSCPCSRYVPVRWTQFLSSNKLRCRCCGCPYDQHAAVEIFDILQMREDKAKTQLHRQTVTPLPPEALEWDDRECALWFLTEGLLHPRRTVGVGRPELPEDARTVAGGPEGLGGRRGRVSVVTPTTESRQRFHEQLWRCFQAQKWPDKELVIVETYFDQPSEFFQKVARQDARLTYVCFQRPRDADWSIGLKRNIAAHLATGEIIANFDDDDVYAANYVDTMVGHLEARQAEAITLSSWFVYNVKSHKWCFCDAIAWGLAQGKDEDSPDVRSWAYGYGFSYLNRRRTALEVPYDDRNMGEDFTFITRLQLAKSDRSVQLVHDDFGICAHIQHGNNTSETFPIRDVTREEALELDVAELMPDAFHTHGSSKAAPSSGARKHVEITAHTNYGDHVVKCPLGATVAEFLERLELAMGDCEELKVHLVPPPTLASVEERQETAAQVLGVAELLQSLVNPDGEDESGARALPGGAASPSAASAGGDNSAYPVAASPTAGDGGNASALAASGVRGGGGASPPGISSEERRRRLQALLRRARWAMRSTDRVPLRTRELWAVPEEAAEPEAASAEVEAPEDSPDGAPEHEPLITVEVAVQLTDAKKFFKVPRTFRVMVCPGATVATFREVVGQDLAPSGRVMVPRGKEAMMALQDSEELPDKVTVTEFKGKRQVYVKFTRAQCYKVLSLLRGHLEKAESQKALHEAAVEVAEDEMEYRLRLSQFLMTEAYPVVCRHFGLGCDGVESLRVIPAGMYLVDQHLELLELQLKVETLMKNRGTINFLMGKINELRHKFGLPPADYPPHLLNFVYSQSLLS